MSISDIYSTGEHKRNLGHFANIVKLAYADAIVTEGEQKLLNKLANRLDISETETKAIIANPEKFPMNPPVSYDARIKRLYDLTKMMFADNEAVSEEATVLRKIAVGIGFPLDNAEKVTDEAIHLVMNDNDLEDFTTAIKRVNSI